MDKESALDSFLNLIELTPSTHLNHTFRCIFERDLIVIAKFVATPTR
ncbi:13845_t:CDS:2, partial [Racocetra persica]